MTEQPRPDDHTGSHLLLLPTWARIVTLVGVPSTIALYLVYSMNTRAEILTDQLNTIQNSLNVHQAMLADHIADGARAATAIERYMLRICVNTATTPADRQECIK